MESKERVVKTLQHQNTNTIPVDFGSTGVTGIHVLVVEKLRDYYGLEKKPVKVIEPYQFLGEVDDELLDAMKIDVYGIIPRNNMFGIPNENWKEYKTLWGQDVLVPGDFNPTADEEGNLYIHPAGDTSVPPSAKMPRTGYFFDAIIRQGPIDDSKIDVNDNLEEFAPVSDEDLEYWKSEVEKAKNKGRSIIATFGGTALGDIALVPAMNLKHPKGIRDISEWYMSILARPDYVKELFDKQSDIAISNLEKIFKVVGNDIDSIFICGTDFGTQDSQFCDVNTYMEMYHPYYKRVNDWIHKHTSWKTFKHSCGAVEPLIPAFIESGFDILNPVQINAAGMEPRKLKEKYGDDIVFWGGGVDTQKTLPFGSSSEVKEQVKRQCDILARDGGFVFNTIHNIQANVPFENVIAMLEALDEVNGK